MSDRRLRRWPVVAVIAAAVVGAVVADAQLEPDRDGQRVVAGPAVAPVAAPDSALSSTWFCAGGTAEKGGRADSTVWIANPGDEAVEATATFVPPAGGGDPVSVQFSVPGHSRRYLRPADHLSAPFVATLVEVLAGNVVVEHAVTGALGEDVAPCASAASPVWHFADASTARDNQFLLSLFNPFPDDAIADLSFVTDEGRRVPADLQGVVVPGGSLVVVDVGAHIRRWDHIATTVEARSGRLVADRVQLRGVGPQGIDLTLGAPSPGELWYFPESVKADGASTTLALYNPGDSEAQVDVELTLEEGEVEPFQLSVPPHDRVIVDLSAEERIPAGVPHSLTVRSMNGVPVVAERWVYLDQSQRDGMGALLGGRVEATEWVFAVGASVPTIDEWIVVQNPGRETAVVDVIALAGGQPLAIDGLQDVEVEAGGRVSFQLGDHIRREDLAVLVRSTDPVVVQRDLYRLGKRGFSASIGIPLR